LPLCAGCTRKRWLQNGQKVISKKRLACSRVRILRQTHFFQQPVLQRAEQSLNTPFGLRTVGRDPSHI
jgi:hypothetical protein